MKLSPLSQDMEYHIFHGDIDRVDKLLLIGMVVVMLFVVYQLGVNFEIMMEQVEAW